MNLSEFRFIAPPHAPFAADGSLDLAIVARQAAFVAEQGVQGVFVAGSTGECTSLTDQEREFLTERWVEVAAGAMEVIVQVGHNSQRVAMQLAAHAQQVGADAVAALAPSYFKPESVDDLIEFLAPVAAAAGDLPFYFYDIPMLTHVQLSMVDFLVRGKQRIPNLVGLKYTNPDLMQLQEVVQLEEGHFEILYGCDETLLAGAAYGAWGAVGSSYNFATPLFRGIVKALEQGDWASARRGQAQAVALIRIMRRRGFLASCKAAMALAGVDCGPVRPPLRPLSGEEIRQLQGELEPLELFSVQPSALDLQSRA